MRWLYSLLWYLIAPLILLRLFWVSLSAPAYRGRFAERFGFYRGEQSRGCIWLHAVSVGETLAAAPLIRALLEQSPDIPLLVTSTTPTGSEQVRSLFGDRVMHVYWPWDLPGAVARLFRHFSPRLVLLLETELWPNLVRAANTRQIPVLLVNGRLSAKSHRGYSRWRSLTGSTLSGMSLLAVQTEAEALRFIDLGARKEAVVVTGNVKFDMQIEDRKVETARLLRASFLGRPVWMAASIHAGEDEIVLAAHQRILAQYPGALLVLVPRHQERFDQVADLIKSQGFQVAQRSRGQAATSETQVYLADTMGELLALYGACDVAFVGGSLVPVGGHNLLEPAAWQKPVLTGPTLHNFTEVSALLHDADALVIVENASELSFVVMRLFANPDEALAMGKRGEAVVNAHRGALKRLLGLLAPFIKRLKEQHIAG